MSLEAGQLLLRGLAGHAAVAGQVRRESELVSEPDLSALRSEENPADAEQLARLLVKRKLLTAYQAQQAFAGKAKSLVLGNYPNFPSWKFSCRAGTTTPFWPGSTPTDLERAGWFQVNAIARLGKARPEKVGSLEANPFGLYDVHGNAREWMYDAWNEKRDDRIENGAAIDPLIHEGSDRIVRGGGVMSDAAATASATRDASWAGWRAGDFSFRVSLSVDAVRQALTSMSAREPADRP